MADSREVSVPYVGERTLAGVEKPTSFQLEILHIRDRRARMRAASP
jgi:hypothetical protein